MALVIIGREIAISALREWMAQIGASRSVAVHMLGKLKTVVQMIAIPFLLYHGMLFGLIDTQLWGTVADLDRRGADDLVDGVLPAEGPAGNPRARVAEAMQRAIVRAMPWVFVLIWSTGFVVARLAMPHAPPFSFLAVRFALSAVCFFVWIALARAAWPDGRAQWGHLAVTGLLMQAGYLGGVWSAVKAGIGAGTVALLVGLQPVLTALWVTATASRAGRGRVASAGCRRDSGSASCSASPGWRSWSGPRWAPAR